MLINPFATSIYKNVIRTITLHQQILLAHLFQGAEWVNTIAHIDM